MLRCRTTGSRAPSRLQIAVQLSTIAARLSAPLLSMFAGLALASCGVLPAASPAYNLIWQYLMPLGAALYLLESDLRQLGGSARSTLLAFVIGAVGTVAGTLVAWEVLGSRLGPDGWKVAAALCGSFVGGSVNFAAVAQSFGLGPSPLLAASMTADNIAMACYLTLIMLIPAKEQDASPQPRLDQPEPVPAVGLPVAASKLAAEAAVAGSEGSSVGVGTLAPALAAAMAACWAGHRAGIALGMPDAALAFVALIASLIASAGTALSRDGRPGEGPFAGEHCVSLHLGGLRRILVIITSALPLSVPQLKVLHPSSSAWRAGRGAVCAEALGGVLMLYFFATIGASAGSLAALRSTGWLTAFILLLLAVHLAVILVGAHLLAGCSMRSTLTASNALIGGPATAAGMAASRDWRDMVRPAVLTGSLGYSIGTAVGCAVGRWLLVL